MGNYERAPTLAQSELIHRAEQSRAGSIWHRSTLAQYCFTYVVAAMGPKQRCLLPSRVIAGISLRCNDLRLTPFRCGFAQHGNQAAAIGDTVLKRIKAAKQELRNTQIVIVE
jgi:hypothetical protein